MVVLNFSHKSIGRAFEWKEHLDEGQHYACQKSFIGKKQVFIEKSSWSIATVIYI